MCLRWLEFSSFVEVFSTCCFYYQATLTTVCPTSVSWYKHLMETHNMTPKNFVILFDASIRTWDHTMSLCLAIFTICFDWQFTWGPNIVWLKKSLGEEMKHFCLFVFPSNNHPEDLLKSFSTTSVFHIRIIINYWCLFIYFFVLPWNKNMQKGWLILQNWWQVLYSFYPQFPLELLHSFSSFTPHSVLVRRHGGKTWNWYCALFSRLLLAGQSVSWYHQTCLAVQWEVDPLKPFLCLNISKCYAVLDRNSMKLSTFYRTDFLLILITCLSWYTVYCFIVQPYSSTAW